MMLAEGMTMLETDDEGGVTTNQTELGQTVHLKIIFILGCQHGCNLRQIRRLCTFLTDTHERSTYACVHVHVHADVDPCIPRASICTHASLHSPEYVQPLSASAS
jgi:hypothetical protein